jgi:predicted DNA binding CopG/RHH family protein
MSKLKKIPEFKNEEEEREFWASHDSSEYMDWNKSKRGVFSNLQPSTKTISLRLPEYVLDEIKMLARKRDVPYQSLIKIFLKDRLNKEMRHSGTQM